MSYERTAILVAGCFLVPALAFALKPPPPLQQADAIFLGRQVGQSSSGGGMSLIFAVDVPICGNLLNGSQVTVYYPIDSEHEQRFRPRPTDLNVFFLQMVGTQYQLMGMDFEGLGSERGLWLPSTFDASALADAVPDKNPKILKIVEAHLLATAGQFPSAESATNFLASFPSPETAAFLAQLSKSKNISLSSISLVARVVSGDFSALSDFGVTVPWHAGSSSLNAMYAALANVRAGDLVKIQQLGSFYLAGKAVRRKESYPMPLDFGALQVLARIHTRETVPFLLSGLSGGDPLETGAALSGLGAFIASQPIGTLNGQAEDPSEIVVEHTTMLGNENPN